MKAADIRNLTVEELAKQILDNQDELLKLLLEKGIFKDAFENLEELKAALIAAGIDLASLTDNDDLVGALLDVGFLDASDLADVKASLSLSELLDALTTDEAFEQQVKDHVDQIVEQSKTYFETFMNSPMTYSLETKLRFGNMLMGQLMKVIVDSCLKTQRRE